MRLRRSTAIFLSTLAACSVPLAISSCSEEDSLVAGPDADGSADASAPVKVQILGINDFHGNLDPPSGSSGTILADQDDPAANNAPDAGKPSADAGTKFVPVGGVAYLAAHIRQLQAGNPNTAIVSSGDLTGASPFVSALFNDEPSVLVMNAIGLDFNGVGNHEFDHGVGELLRLQYGGCHPTKGCASGLTSFPGASYEYLAANVDVAKNKTIFPPYGVKEMGGVKVGFIGMTLKDTPSVTIPSAVAGLSFDDEVATVNALVPEIRLQGVSAIVVLLHQGNVPATGTVYNGCGVVDGVIADIATKLDPAIDVVFSAHTHQAYNCTIGGKLVTSASSFGRVLTQVELTIEPAQKRVTAKTAANHMVTRDIAPDPAVQAIITDYTQRSAVDGARVIGHITTDLRAAPPAGGSGESSLGDIIADGMLSDTQKPGFDAVLAVMNPGGIRGDIVFNPANGSHAAGEVTYAQAFATQPFSNYLVTATLTGAQIKTLLEQQWASTPPRILQVSKGFAYTYSASAPNGSKVDPASIKINGVTVTAAGSYRVTTNNFVAAGGDGFAVFKQTTNVTNGRIDLEALESYFKSADPLAPPALNRITVVP